MPIGTRYQMSKYTKVVVVESPAKAKTINKYLGDDYYVLASYGHVRDLPPRDGSVDPDNNFDMLWMVDTDAEKRVKDIAKSVRTANTLILATDPDREGEAISWHIHDELAKRDLLVGKQVQRVVFNEITKAAIQDAFAQPRAVDQDLVDAYMARRALDYLVGFKLSPVLWRKLPGSKSAGRVQSVALRLICEREDEIEAFNTREYWDLDVALTGGSNEFDARLTHLGGEKLNQFDISDQDHAERIKAQLMTASSFLVASIDKKRVKRNPAAPFRTSTLQQEAARKLGFGSAHTMRIAQRLYEGVSIGGDTVGLITYMRTDGTTLSGDAISEARKVIDATYGSSYVPESPRQYKTKQKNAQEAHEAIRPTSLARRPEEVAKFVPDDQARLYRLIWQRTLASQMASAQVDQTTAIIDVDNGAASLRANGSIQVFDGFLKVYQEGRDDNDTDEEYSRALPPLEKHQALVRNNIIANQHFTQPPPRYTEASLVKKMEELGIGRPSTYASIIQVLQTREYVRLEQRRFITAERGRVVTSFLVNYFTKWVQYDFTAGLEDQLDEISGGRVAWIPVLDAFWHDFSAQIDQTMELRITEVLDTLDAALGSHFFPASATKNGFDPRKCPSCEDGRLGLKFGKTGGFIGCSNYPTCKMTHELTVVDKPLVVATDDDDPLGLHPESGLPIYLKKGPYGWYVQLGLKSETLPTPKRASLERGDTPEGMTFERAVKLLELPRDVGLHEGDMITAGVGRFGPFVRHKNVFANLPKDESPLTIGLNRAIDLLEQKKEKDKARQGVEWQNHPADGEPIWLGMGRWGPFFHWHKSEARVPKGTDADSMSVEQVVKMLKAYDQRKGLVDGKPPAKKKTTAKKKSAKTAPKTKKSAAKRPRATKT